MLVVVSYDVCTETAAGRKRLRQISKEVLDYGNRVQYSVYECDLEPAQWEKLKSRLLKLYDPKEDSLRFYFLGKHWRRRLEHHGQKDYLSIDEPMIL
ncbi:MAG: CRISPR-associated endonuclease Cas2 [Deltaproteobacteria bacterium]|nr:CRISPR-associated endonuclease Cas2 [Deltaproteobacteria bacterium]MBN2673410.1 CRISPR-associated endonuclease Cas2 [Deltaproteobacteria bacterium]